MKNKKLKIAPSEIPKTRKRKTNKKSNGKTYKTLTIIFGVATFVFGTASILLTIYSINLQKREAESRRILQQIESLLTTLSDTTTNPDVQNAAKFIQSEIPKDYNVLVQRGNKWGQISKFDKCYKRRKWYHLIKT